MLVAVLLAIPVEATVRVDHRDETTVEVVMGWFAGRIQHVLVTVPGEDASAAKTDEEPREERDGTKARDEEPDEGGKSAWEKAQPALALVRSEGFLGHVAGWMRASLASLTLREVSLWARFGTGDPAGTGELFGRFQAVLPPVYASRRARVDLTPEFEEAVFEGGGSLTLRARPLRLLWEGVVFVFSPVMFRAVLAAWRARPDA